MEKKKKLKIKVRGNNPLLGSRSPRVIRGSGAVAPRLAIGGGLGGGGRPSKG